MLQNKPKSSSGFTIIEVLIVLAIAGLILVIVLLAVPALQRNARNTTIKNDATALAGGFQEYASNNDGAQPASPLVQDGSKVTIGASGSNQAEAKVAASTTVTVSKVSGPPTTYTPGTLWWATGVDCNGGTSARAISVYFYIETTGGTHNPSCVSGS